MTCKILRMDVKLNCFRDVEAASGKLHRLLAILLVAIVRGSVGVIVRLDSVPTVVNDPLWQLSVDRDAETEVGFLRRLRFEVPTLRYTATPTSNALLAGGQTNNSGTTEYINGTASRFVVTYKGTTQATVRTALKHALAVWADVYPRSVQLRFEVRWETLRVGTLASAISPLSVLGPWRGLRTGIAYTPVLATCITGHDATTQQLHATLVFNSAFAWHMDSHTPAPAHQYDLVIAALHEAAHALFFTGAVTGRPRAQTAVLASAGGRPTRLDTFLRTERGDSVLGGGCDALARFRAITSNRLMFRLPSGADWPLYAPYPHHSGSSTYHFDAAGLRAACAKYLVACDECTDLMTHQFRRGYTQHSIGVPTLRIMRAVRGHVDAPIETGNWALNQRFSATPPGAYLPDITSLPEESFEPKTVSLKRMNEGCVAVEHLTDASLLYRRHLRRLLMLSPAYP